MREEIKVLLSSFSIDIVKGVKETVTPACTIDEICYRPEVNLLGLHIYYRNERASYSKNTFAKLEFGDFDCELKAIKKVKEELLEKSLQVSDEPHLDSMNGCGRYIKVVNL